MLLCSAYLVNDELFQTVLALANFFANDPEFGMDIINNLITIFAGQNRLQDIPNIDFRKMGFEYARMPWL